MKFTFLYECLYEGTFISTVTGDTDEDAQSKIDKFNRGLKKPKYTLGKRGMEVSK